MVGVRPWGMCSVCGHKRSLRYDGTVRIHHAEGQLHVQCEGSLKPPKGQ